MTRVIVVKHVITRNVVVPDGATHISNTCGLLDEEPRFYKCTQVGVVGDHWWFWNYKHQQWHFVGHATPYWIRELPQEQEVTIQSNWEPSQEES